MRGASPISRLALTCALGAAVLAVAAPAALGDWTRPFNVSGALTQDALPSVGISDAGVSLYAWRRTVSGIQRIQIRTRSAAGALGSVTNVSSSLSATQPEVEMNGGGTAAVLYVQFDGTDDRLAVNVRTSGGSISARQLVSGSGSTISDFAGGIDDTNRALLVWRSGAGVRARFRAADGTLSPIKALSNSFGASHPRVAVNGAGNCVIVWTQDTVVHIRSCSTAAQTFGSDKIASAGVADDPEVGISDAGRAVAVWSRFDNGANENRIEARVLTTSGTLAATKTIESAASGSPLFQPHVAVDGAGLAAIAYRAEDVAGSDIIDIIKAATLPTSNNPTTPIPFSRDAQDTGEPTIAIDDAGVSDVAWPVRAGVDSHITSRPLAADGSAGTRITVSDLASSIDDPEVARSGPGAAAMVWHGNDEVDDVVQGAFDPAP